MNTHHIAAACAGICAAIYLIGYFVAETPGERKAYRSAATWAIICVIWALVP